MVPNRYFEFTLDLLYKMDVQLGNDLGGQFVDALTFGVLSIIALWILGVNYFVFLGAFAGLANLIPYVGPIAGMVPAAIVAVLKSGSLGSALAVVIAFVILKLIYDFVVQPLVVALSVELHLVLVLIAIISAESCSGYWARCWRFQLQDSSRLYSRKVLVAAGGTGFHKPTKQEF